jgi:endonuclease/exonuclease/phosphatase family metal-dependent hydrolase
MIRLRPSRLTKWPKGLKNAFREKGSGLGRTYNGDFPNYQIDYIMTSPQFEVFNYKVIEKNCQTIILYAAILY